MSLLEGHADVRHGRRRARRSSRRVATIRERFNQRRKGAGPLDRVLRRLLGLDAKMAQYRDGARLRRAASSTRSAWTGFNAVWDGPGEPAALEPRSPTRRLGARACTAARPSPPDARDGRSRPGGRAGPPRRPAGADRRRTSRCWSPARGRRLAGAGRRRRLRGAAGRACAVGGVTVDHGLQAARPSGPPRSPRSCARPRASTRSRSSAVERRRGGGGPEAAARDGAVRRARTAAAERLGAARCCSATPSTTRPRRCCSGWPAARAPGRWPGCGAGRGRYRRPLLGVRRARPRAPPARPQELAGLGRPAQRRPRASPGSGCGTGCCRCSRTSSAAASPRRWPAPPTSCARTLDALDALGRAPSSTALADDGGLRRRRRWPRCPPALRRRVLRGWLARRRRRARPARPCTSTRVDALVTALARAGPGRPARAASRRVRACGRLVRAAPTARPRGARSVTSLRRTSGAPWTRRTATAPTSSTSSSPRSRSSARLAELADADRGATTRARTCCSSASSRARCMVMADLARALQLPRRDGLDGGLVLRLGHQVLRRRADPQGPRPDITGRHVLIVEDIIDSGLTLSWLLTNLASRGPASRRDLHAAAQARGGARSTSP